MIVYAILHKPTGKMLPLNVRLKAKNGAPATHISFTLNEPQSPEVRIPRLFIKEQYAKLALKQWLRGKLYRKPIFEEGNEVDYIICVEPTHYRHASDMEIIKLRITGALS